MQAQSGCLIAVLVDVAVEPVAIGIKCVPKSESSPEYAMLASQISWLRDRLPPGAARACLGVILFCHRTSTSLRRGVRQRDHQESGSK